MSTFGESLIGGGQGSPSLLVEPADSTIMELNLDDEKVGHDGKAGSFLIESS